MADVRGPRRDDQIRMTPLEQLSSALTGRYEIEREIGAGGMATVFLARDVKHRRPVALKVLKPELGAVLGVERFLAEIQVTANLQHPNLLPLFDSGGRLLRRPAIPDDAKVRWGAECDLDPRQLAADGSDHARWG
jgi:serine/threonine protein kinase